MKRQETFGFGLGCGVAAALACVCADPAVAQQQPAEPPAKAAPKPTRPPVAAGPGSLTGVWFSAAFKDYRTGPPTGEPRIRKTVDGQDPPMRPEVAAIVDKRIKDFYAGHPYANTTARCLPGGVPMMMFPPPELPLQIVESPGQVTVLFEFFQTFRVIRLNEKHQDDPDPTYFGDSVGHWEGDTLVVDTVGLTDKTAIDGLIPHSDQLHVVERLRRTGPDTLEDRVTVEDPKTFTRPYTYVSALKQVPGGRMDEYICEDNRNAPDASGATGVQMPSSAR
jgi:hypothetical protein